MSCCLSKKKTTNINKYLLLQKIQPILSRLSEPRECLFDNAFKFPALLQADGGQHPVGAQLSGSRSFGRKRPDVENGETKSTLAH